jgi:hypothetical protein
LSQTLSDIFHNSRLTEFDGGKIMAKIQKRCGVIKKSSQKKTQKNKKNKQNARPEKLKLT